MPALPLMETGYTSIRGAPSPVKRRRAPITTFGSLTRWKGDGASLNFLGRRSTTIGPCTFLSRMTGPSTRSSPREIGYAELQDGRYAEAQRLPDEINYLREVAHPAVAPDESYLIIDSYYEEGGRLAVRQFSRAGWLLEQSSEYARCLTSRRVGHLCQRLDHAGWGEYIFFEKYEPETDQSGIYWVSARVTEELRSDRDL
jgi:hypothetical protein